MQLIVTEYFGWYLPRLCISSLLCFQLMNECSSGTDVGLAQRSKLLLRGPDGNYHRLMGLSICPTSSWLPRQHQGCHRQNVHKQTELSSNKVQSTEPGTPLIELEAKLRTVYVSVPLKINDGNSVFAAERRKEIPRNLQPKNWRKDSFWSPICIFNIFTITFSYHDNQ